MEKKIRNLLNMVLQCILEIIYPRENKCIVCGDFGEEGLCNNCRNKIMPCNDESMCIGYYGNVLKKLILEFKYKKNFVAGEILVELITCKLVNFEKDYILTYIPVSKKTLKERGFNQCEYLAKKIGFEMGFDVEETMKKVRETDIQKTLKRQERLQNIKGAFEVVNTSRIEGKKYILIDDVITTGSTVEEGEKILKESGAKEIKILTLAKSYI